MSSYCPTLSETSTCRVSFRKLFPSRVHFAIVIYCTMEDSLSESKSDTLYSYVHEYFVNYAFNPPTLFLPMLQLVIVYDDKLVHIHVYILVMYLYTTVQICSHVYIQIYMYKYSTKKDSDFIFVFGLWTLT